jgi:1,4-alpha-glucan branching enzyme
MSPLASEELGGQLRVLMLSADYVPDNWSGIGVAVASQARNLVGLGVHVEVLSAAPATVSSSSQGVRVHRLSRERCGVRLEDFDVLHVHSLALAELAGEMCRRSRLSLVYSAHSVLQDELSDRSAAASWGALQRRLCRLAAHVVFVSGADRQRALGIFPELADKSSVVPNGLEPCSRRTGGDKRDAGRPTLLFVGRFCERKGLPLLERVLPELVRRDGVRVRLVGGHGDRVGDACIEALRRQLGDACEVVAWCSREALADYYAEAELVLVPSEYEPFGLVALEAMQHGCPVLASATGGLAENIGADSGGVLVDSREPQRWIAEARSLLRDPTRRAALAARGPAYVGRHFSPRAAARRLVSEAYFPALRRLRRSIDLAQPCATLPAAFDGGAPNLERDV